jgi:hypothetical protein
VWFGRYGTSLMNVRGSLAASTGRSSRFRSPPLRTLPSRDSARGSLAQWKEGPPEPLQSRRPHHLIGRLPHML